MAAKPTIDLGSVFAPRGQGRGAEPREVVGEDQAPDAKSGTVGQGNTLPVVQPTPTPPQLARPLAARRPSSGAVPLKNVQIRVAEGTADDLALIVYWRGKDRQELLGPVLTQWIDEEVERVRQEMEDRHSR